MGRDYRRIVLYLCTETDYQSNYSCNVFREDPGYISCDSDEEGEIKYVKEEEALLHPDPVISELIGQTSSVSERNGIAEKFLWKAEFDVNVDEELIIQ